MTLSSVKTLPSLITISIPVYNEEDNIARLLERLRTVTDKIDGYGFEFLFTDNASTDRTFELLNDAAEKDARIRVLRFTRNFGFQASILTNYLQARGAAAIQLDADLQDPPELIAQFLDKWREGYKVVYGIRRRRPENVLMSATRKLFYRIIHRLGTADAPVDAGDFRLVDRVIIEHLRSIKDNSVYLRGLIAELGYAQTGIPYDREARVAGASKFRLPALMRLAVDGVCSQSTKPLEIITLFGFTLSLLSVMGALGYLVFYFLHEDMQPGFTTLVILMLFSTGINAAFTGLLGEYIGRIFKNTRQIPFPIIEHRIESVAQSEADNLNVFPHRRVQELS